MKKLFTGFDFWFALITLFVLIMGVFNPGYGMDVPHAAAFAAASAAYLVSLAIAPAAFSWGSRKFWFTVISLIYIFLDSFKVFPGQLDVVGLAGGVAAVALYVIGLAKDPGRGWAGLLVSRKFLALVVSILTIILRAYNLVFPAGITAEQLVSVLLGMFALIIKAAYGDVQPAPDVEVTDDMGAVNGAG